MTTPYDDLVARGRTVATVNSVAAVLQWDQQTFMPRNGAGLRGDQLALLAGLAHERGTDPRVGELLDACAGETDPVRAANVREFRRSYDRAVKLPARLVEELARVTTHAHEAWVAAREANDFPAFRPWLEKVLALKREEAAAVGYAAHPYDALLDEYEPGATAAELKILFADLERGLVPLVRTIAESGKRPDRGILERDFPVDRQKMFAEAAAAAIGFDFAAGRLDVAAHPFCSGFGPGDCRITTRYNPRAFNEAFFGVLHEAGHGLYEQNLPAEHFGTAAGTYCSLGVHESQSRLWENQIGRGADFWRHFFPRLRQTFPGPLAGVSEAAFHFAVNDVRPSFIRVEADEATYNLHILLRFELELALVTGDLPVADLPAAWDAKFHALFGLTPPTDRDGCLQDVHWGTGGVGYFPTYTLGNLLAAQLMDAAAGQIPGLADAVRAGDFVPLAGWLAKAVHGVGRVHLPGELCERVTGAALTPGPFLAYLGGKFAPLYGL